MRRRQDLDNRINGILRIERTIDDSIGLIEMGEAENDQSVVTDAENTLLALNKEVAAIELDTLLSGEADANDSYLQIQAGAGGTESQDWALMLMRMYVRWANLNKYKVEVLDEHAGEEAGIKSCTLVIKGHNAYGKLKTENGVHRLVRISPYDSNARRHTSFSSVASTPVIDDEIDIQVVDSDLKVDTYRASGAGGQHVNTTDSAVRITHVPTGIIVACQAERSQHKNRATALKMLKSKLYELELQKKQEKNRRQQRAENRHRLGPPDQIICPAALSNGQGPAHRIHQHKPFGRPRRLHRRLHPGISRTTRLRRRA
jgi:peptide chain release factor 2